MSLRSRFRRAEAPPATRTGPGFPVLASIVPVVGAVGLWAFTGSLVSLWFAALGPLFAAASAVDRSWSGRREGRRERRRARVVAEERDAQEALARDADRDAQWALTPDIHRLLAAPAEIWRDVPGRATCLVLGSAGAAPGAPVTTELSGICHLLGSSRLVGGVLRAMVIQLCLVHPPGAMQLVGPLPPGCDWIDTLPHRQHPAPIRVAFAEAGRWAGEVDAQLTIVVGPSAVGGVRARVEARAGEDCVLDVAGQRTSFRPQVLSTEQAARIADHLARIHPSFSGSGPLHWDDQSGSADEGGRTSLSVSVGSSGIEPTEVSLVSDGPHALITGTTGSGKSELLRTWVVAMAARARPDEVMFLLADFKGGATFESLRSLPHVCGILTDLDEHLASRALESLRAEIRQRERRLSEAGVRDISEMVSAPPRLVLVVDEFAALLSSHPELASLFVDLAARGRALGVHLILGTQRAGGVFRDALLANCALRISLRAADSADSRLMLGDDRAAFIPGGAVGVGRALVRRAGDQRASPFRVAVVSDETVATIARRWPGATWPPPWLPPLPPVVPFPRQPTAWDETGSGASDEDSPLLVGLADEPEHQRQVPRGIGRRARGVCVVGGAGAGRTTALLTVGAQCPHPIRWLGPDDLEATWDAIAAASVTSQTLVIDGLDEVICRLPPDYAAEALQRLEVIIRRAGQGHPVLLSAERLTGAVGRLADLLPHRLLLRHSHRADFLAHGGQAQLWSRSAPPGRGVLDGALVQVYSPPAGAVRPESEAADRERWMPTAPQTAWITRPTPEARDARRWWEAAGVAVGAIADESFDDSMAPSQSWMPGVAARVIVGEPDQWQRAWTTLTRLRARGPVLIDSSCAAEYRVFSGLRELPPLCESGHASGWILEPGLAVRRVRL